MLLNELPDDVLLGIFAALNDAVEVVRATHVCKRWRQLAQHTPHLFRNALFLEQGVQDPTIQLLYARLCGVARMSGGRVDQLGLRIGNSLPKDGQDSVEGENERQTLRALIEMLSTLQLKKLYVSMEDFVVDDDPSFSPADPRQSTRSAFNDLRTLLNTLGISGLKSLVVQLKIPGHIDHAELSTEIIGRSNRINVHDMDYLRLSGGVWPVFFRNVSDPRNFSRLSRLHLEDLDFRDEKDVKALYAMLEAVQDTLCELVLDLGAWGVPLRPNGESVRTITFSKLTTFHLRYAIPRNFFSFSLDPSDHNVYDFYAPLLDTGFSLDCNSELVIFKELMTPMITDLTLTALTVMHKKCVEALQQCTGLRRVMLNCLKDTLIVSLDEFKVVRFHEFVVLVDQYFNTDELTTWIERRKQDPTTAIEHITFCDASIMQSNDRLSEHGLHFSAFQRIAAIVPSSRYTVCAKEICSYFPPVSEMLEELYRSDPTYDSRNDM